MTSKESNSKFPYPTARITRHLRKEIKDKMISSKVKMATNQFLGDLTLIVAHEMNRMSDKSINLGAFEKASKPYTYAASLDEEQKEVVMRLEKVRHRMEKLIRDFRTKFEIADENEFKVGHDEIERLDKGDRPKSIGEMTIDELDA